LSTPVKVNCFAYELAFLQVVVCGLGTANYDLCILMGLIFKARTLLFFAFFPALF
jgi:hypothetical protein